MNRTYQVVVNLEEQYSIWEADRQPPDGWRAYGFTGGREECLRHIAEVWTDMRPLSVRNGDESAEAAEATDARIAY
ncbi:MbtH family NRPS accessory protein [Micromonospora sp. CPCC 205371]|nr:MbtH family NRPS accessory protein [Micromonospora sp. CPCC 205371]